jgi:hypothetical protein
MAQQDRSTIKTFFETGDIPTEAQFGDSFDSQVFWVDDVVTTIDNTSTDAEIPTAKAVYDAQTFTKDADGNVLYQGLGPTLGTSCGRNIFYQSADATLGNGCQENVFLQGVQGITLGTGCSKNIFEMGVGNFVFGNNLQNVTIKSGSIGADYTNLTNYGFLYNLDYDSEIFRNPEDTANYHRYYDPTNDRIVLTLLAAPYTVSYIGGGGGDVYLANDQTFTGENTFAIGSGTKEPIIVTKGGNGAGIKVTKSSGSGDAIEVAQGSLSIADETASRIAIFDSNKRVKSGNTSTYPSLTEIEHVKGVTSAIQTQLNAKVDTFTTFMTIGTWSSPADSLSYYAPIFGGITTPITTVTTFLSSFSFACKIIGVYVQHLNNSGTQGSSENVAIQLRNNIASTSTQLINIQTNQASGVQKNFEDYSLNISIAANDQIALQINTPAWATNPTNAILRVSLFIQRT